MRRRRLLQFIDAVFRNICLTSVCISSKEEIHTHGTAFYRRISFISPCPADDYHISVYAELSESVNRFLCDFRDQINVQLRVRSQLLPCSSVLSSLPATLRPQTSSGVVLVIATLTASSERAGFLSQHASPSSADNSFNFV